MAQHWWQPDPDDVGSAPPNWSLTGSGAMEIQTAGGEYWLRCTGGSARKGFLIDTIDGVSMIGIGDCQLRMEWEYPSTAGYECKLMGRESAGADNGYHLGPLPNDNKFRIDKVTSFTFSVLSESSWTGIGGAANTRYIVLAELVGTALRVKFWEKGTSEPGWTLETTDSDHASGAIGLFLFRGDSGKVYNYSVGTGGDPAPTEPVGGATRRFNPLLLAMR